MKPLPLLIADGLLCCFFAMSLFQPALAFEGRHFKTSDRVALHYVSAGQGPLAVVFVPGWLMPGDVFKHQVAALSERYRVVVLDPRGQGRSQVKVRDMSAERRANDVKELVEHLGLNDYVLVGWSLGVMEILETTTRHRMPGLRGMVLIDNSIGMGPAPTPSGKRAGRPLQKESFRRYVSDFSRAIFKRPPQDGLVELIERSASQLEPSVAWRLLDKPHAREYYKQAVLAARVPLWYAITPRFSVQGEELLGQRSQAVATVFEDAGHALFVDSAEAFNAGLLDFLSRLR